jgi:hypothetical protein
LIALAAVRSSCQSGVSATTSALALDHVGRVADVLAELRVFEQRQGGLLE